jgi:AraC family transcriptional regulator, transcriptional activator FtrA
MVHHRVAVVVPQDFALFELGIAVEVFAAHRPELPDDWYEVSICSASPGPLTAAGGVLAAAVPHGVQAIDEAHTIIVPEAAANLGEPAEPEVLAAIQRAYRRGARIVSFCTGTFVLAAAGVLRGRTVTTHWKYAAQLARAYPEVRVHADVLYVDDGQVLTSAGLAAGADLALHIVRCDHGARVAREVARHLVMAPHRAGGQAQFIMSPVPESAAAATGVYRAMDHVSRNIDQDFNLSAMASLAYMSTRNFSRRFREVTGTTPSQWVLNLRLTRARELLEETDESVERIAQLAGFGSSVTLRQRFAQVLHTSPTTYRRGFRDSVTSAEAGLPDFGDVGEVGSSLAS